MIWGDKHTPYGPLNEAQPSHHVYPTQFGGNLYRPTPENSPKFPIHINMYKRVDLYTTQELSLYAWVCDMG